MANDEFYEFVKEALYGKANIFIKGECVNCQHYVCTKEDKVEEGPDDVIIYSGVLCPCCLKGHSVLSKEKTRPCSDFDRFPRGGV